MILDTRCAISFFRILLTTIRKTLGFVLHVYVECRLWGCTFSLAAFSFYILRFNSLMSSVNRAHLILYQTEKAEISFFSVRELLPDFTSGVSASPLTFKKKISKIQLSLASRMHMMYHSSHNQIYTNR